MYEIWSAKFYFTGDYNDEASSTTRIKHVDK